MTVPPSLQLIQHNKNGSSVSVYETVELSKAYYVLAPFSRFSKNKKIKSKVGLYFYFSS